MDSYKLYEDPFLTEVSNIWFKDIYQKTICTRFFFKLITATIFK